MAKQELDVEELRRATTERLGPCSLCDGTVWHTPTAPVALPVMEGVDPLPADEGRDAPTIDENVDFPSVVAVPCICGNCGHMIFFHYNSLSEGSLNSDQN
jgi:hypothetical protein